jgi:hypothetical protein
MSFSRWSGALMLGLVAALTVGCANPGPPKPPSLYLPKLVNDLTAKRVGDTVELRFTAPSRTTDNLPLKAVAIDGVFCRELDRKTCVAVGTARPVTVGATSAGAPQREEVVWQDALPAELTAGKPRLVGYRVEFFNAAGKSAGRSEVAVAVAGAAPARVERLQVEGSRLGAVLQWKPEVAHEDVLLQRERLTPEAVSSSESSSAKKAKAEPRVVWMAANGVGRTLDATALPDVAYKYVAVRRETLTFGSRTLEMRSAPSGPVAFTLHEVYPPLAPTGLTAIGFFATNPDTTAGPFSVDLIWQPVTEPGLVAGLAGYNVYREADGARKKLNAAIVALPSFHDATAVGSVRYRYSVTAVDGKGNESPAAMAVVEAVAR